MTEIYLSKGCVNKLRTSKSIYAQATCSEQTVTIRCFTTNAYQVYVLQIRDIVTDVNDDLLLTLFDGEDTLNATVTCNDLINYCEHNRAIEKGDVIFLNSFELKYMENTISIGIKSFYVIGHINLDESNKVSSNGTSKRKLDEESDEEGFKKRIKLQEKIRLISDLDLSWSAFQIKGQLSRKSEIKSFSKGDNAGIFLRFQLTDSSGCIEVVAFEERAKELYEMLELNKYYTIQHASLKIPSQSGYRTWPNEKNLSKYDLMIEKKTIVTESTAEECNHQKSSINTVHSQGEQKKEINQVTDEVTLDQYTSIKDLANINIRKYSRGDEPTCSVLGIVESVEEIKKIQDRNNNPLSLRTFTLMEKGGYYVKVALFGKEAENFQFKRGSILFIYDAKLSSYGGLSLNIFKDTFIQKINPHMNNSVIASLWKWWTTEWWDSRNKDKHFSVNSFVSKNRLNKYE